MAKEGLTSRGQRLKVSTRRTSVTGPKVLTRAAIARGSRSGGTLNPQPRKKRSRQPTKKVEHAADEDVADEVLTPDWEARGVRADQGRGPSQSRDAEVDQAVVPYLTEIHRHYRETEGLKHASPSYMSKQADINVKMRSILIDWLVEVHLHFELMPETLYLTVNLIDRFLEKEQIMRSKLQLVGVTAMFVASKYEEIRGNDPRSHLPSVLSFVHISDYGYTRDDILRMEGLMLARLNFQLTAPNAFVFVKRFAKVAGIATTPRSTTELLANYLVELTLQDYKMLKYLPSLICASAVYLALMTSRRGRSPWTPDLEKHSTYKERDLQACVRDICELHDKATTNSLQVVRKKYTQVKHGNVSSIALCSISRRLRVAPLSEVCCCRMRCTRGGPCD